MFSTSIKMIILFSDFLLSICKETDNASYSWLYIFGFYVSTGEWHEALALHTVKNQSITYSWPFIYSVPPYQIFCILTFNQPWTFNTVAFTIEEKLHIQVDLCHQTHIFNGQLYFVIFFFWWWGENNIIICYY